VNEKIEPPGYEAPLEDFETKAMDGKQGGRTSDFPRRKWPVN
jgi:hypothetical protein